MVLLASRKRVSEDSSQRDDDASSESSSKRARNVEGRPIATQSHPPSLVLHVRSLPAFTTESELIAVLQPYGHVERAFITQHNKQAFVQLASLEAAEAIVAHSASPPGFALRGRQIFLQYSNRKEVVPPPNQNVAMQQQGIREHAPASFSTTGHSAGGGGGGGGGSDQHATAPNSILLISVTNLRVSVTLDHIHAICKPSGPVWKIITFHKNGVFKALVQLGSIEAAIHAKQNLDSKDIFAGCCHVSVGFSSQTELKIVSSGPKARDFLAEGLVTGETTNTNTNNTTQQQTFGTQIQQQQQQQQQQQAQAQQLNPSAFAMMGGYYGGGLSLPMNPYGMAMPANPYAHNVLTPQQLAYGLPYGAPIGGLPPHAPNAAAPSSSAFTSNPAAASSSTPIQQNAGGSVLIASNLPTTSDITPEALFTLFGVYGDVIRVKILYAKRDTAMIQFTTPAGCALAIQHLHHATLDGKQLNVSLSKHDTISMPKQNVDGSHSGGGTEDATALTQDFTSSKNHRFRGKPVNTKNIHSPSQVLHVANLPDGATVDDLKSIFGPSSLIQFFTTDAHMAYVKLPSASDAAMTLIKTHQHKLQNRQIRVSFSGKDVNSFDQQQQTRSHNAPSAPHTPATVTGHTSAHVYPSSSGAGVSTSSTGETSLDDDAPAASSSTYVNPRREDQDMVEPDEEEEQQEEGVTTNKE